MTVDVAFAEGRVQAGRLQKYYGFDPQQEYILRSRNRKYNQITQGYYRFNAGECLAPRLRPDATDEQKWARGERLQWFNAEMKLGRYKIYTKGTQPAADLEAMWVGQEPPEEAQLPDSGEVDAKWEAAPSVGEPLHAPVTTLAAAEALPDDGSAPAFVETVVTTIAPVPGVAALPIMPPPPGGPVTGSKG
jgi:hypothetical protein